MIIQFSGPTRCSKRIPLRPCSQPSPIVHVYLRSVTLPRLRGCVIFHRKHEHRSFPVRTIPPLLPAPLPSAEQIVIGIIPLVGSLTLPSSFEECPPNLAGTPVARIVPRSTGIRALIHDRPGLTSVLQRGVSRNSFPFGKKYGGDLEGVLQRTG